MNKLYLISAIVFSFTIASCEKEYTPYAQSYGVTYYPQKDSFIATAAFSPQSGEPRLLGKKETVSFNGRGADIQTDLYTWRGKGKPDAEFILTRDKKQFSGSMNATAVGTYELICPDTISKAKGFTVKIKGYSLAKEFQVSLGMSDPGKRGAGFSIKADTVFIHPMNLAGWDEGRMLVTFTENQKVNATPDNNMPAVVNYSLLIEKPVYFIK